MHNIGNSDGRFAWSKGCLGAVIGLLASLAFGQSVTVSKSATDGAGNALSPSTVIAPGTQIKYRTTFRYSGATYLPAGQFIDQMSAGQTYVTGSLVKPAEWTQTTPVFDSSNKAVMSTGPLFPNGSLGRLINISTAISSAIQSDPAKGDGLTPIISAATGELFVVNHHAGLQSTPSIATVKCVDIATGNPCSGYAVNGNILTDGGAVQNVMTASFAEQFISGTRIYIPSSRNWAGGVQYGWACWGTAADPAYAGSSCPFIALITDATGFPDRGFSGYRAGNNYYTTYKAQALCFTVPSGASCPGFIAPPALPEFFPGSFSPSVVWLYAGRYLVYGEYQLDATSAPFMVTSCWDISTSSVCAGGAQIEAAEAPLASVAYIAGLGEPGVEAGYCITASTAPSGVGLPLYTMSCRDWATGAQLTPTAEVQRKIQFTKPMHVPGTRKYIYPSAIQDSNRNSICWDYGANAACSGFTDGGAGAVQGQRRWTAASQNGNAAVGRTDDYGYTYFQGCAYGLGDAGTLWSFDPVSGNTPCLSGQASFQQAAPQQQYCDGAQHVTGWLALTIANVNAAVYNATITVRDGTNTVTLLGPTLYPVASGSIVVPLTGISYSTYPVLNIDVQLASDVVPNGASPATAVLTFASDRSDQDVCYTAAAPSNCGPNTIVTNDVRFLDASGNLVASAPAVNGGVGATQTTCQGPQVSIAKTTSTTTYTPGVSKPVNYSVTVTNNGAVATATNLSVTDPAPAGVTIDSWSCPTCTPTSGGSGTINTAISSLAPLASATITVNGTITSAATGPLTNIATVTPPSNGNCVGDVCAASATTGPGAIVSATKVSSAAHYQLGGSTAITYTIVVSNSGTVASTATAINDTAPVGTLFSSWTCSGCTTSAGTGNVVTTANIPAGSSVTVVVNAVVQPSASGTVTNTATITPVAPDGCSTSTACAPSVAVTPGAIVSATKVSSAAHYQLGGSTAITYTIVVSNSGTVASTATAINDTAPVGTLFSSWTCSGCTTSAGTGNVVTTANIPAGSSVTVVVNAVVQPSASGTVTNTATITPVAPDGCSTSTACAPRVTVTPGAIISAVKTGSTAQYQLGGSTAITYTIVVSNSGTVASTATAINDTAPVGTLFSAWSCAGCVTTSGTGNVVTMANISAGGAVTVVVTATVTATAVGRITNQANVLPTAPDACVSGASCNPTHGIDPAVARITATKTSSLASYTVGTQTDVVYTIVVRNTGTLASTSTEIADSAPAGVSIVNWTCDACITTSGNGNVLTTANIAPGGAATVIVNAVIARSAIGTVTNTAAVTPVDPDTCLTADGCNPTVSITAYAVAVEVPTLNTLLLILMCCLLLAGGAGSLIKNGETKA